MSITLLFVVLPSICVYAERHQGRSRITCGLYANWKNTRARTPREVAILHGSKRGRAAYAVDHRGIAVRIAAAQFDAVPKDSSPGKLETPPPNS